MAGDAQRATDAAIEAALDAWDRRDRAAPPAGQAPLWAALWQSCDFSWEGLADAGWEWGDGANAAQALKRWDDGSRRTLQDYWRAGSDAEMEARGLLVWHEGRRWHVLHRSEALGAAAIDQIRERLGRMGVQAPLLLAGARARGFDRVLWEWAGEREVLHLRAPLAELKAWDVAGLRLGDGADFRRAMFGDGAGFRDATFGAGARFEGAMFGAIAWFERATFGDGARFEGATFGDGAGFWHATFGAGAWFGQATFGDKAMFGGATFGDDAEFWGARFGDGARFEEATFGDRAGFGGARFGDRAEFRQATFGDEAGFGGARFGAGASLRGARFAGVSFEDALFEGRLDADGASFEGWTVLGRRRSGAMRALRNAGGHRRPQTRQRRLKGAGFAMSPTSRRKRSRRSACSTGRSSRGGCCWRIRARKQRKGCSPQRLAQRRRRMRGATRGWQR